MLLNSVIGGLELAADPIAQDTLIAALEHPEPVVRWSAAGALNRIGTGKWVQPMKVQFAQETDTAARFAFGQMLASASKYWTAQDALASVAFDWPAVRIAAALKAEAQALLDLREATAADELKALVGASPVPDADKVLTEALREHQIRTVQR